jgi:endonuclease/exonuclease/phosphatase family metal-dependent hydrolase
MESQQIMKLLLAMNEKMDTKDARKTDREEMIQEIRAAQENIQENLKKTMKAMMTRMEEDSKAWREQFRPETEAIQARTKAMQDERLKANIDACILDIKMVEKKRQPAKTQWRLI